MTGNCFPARTAQTVVMPRPLGFAHAHFTLVTHADGTQSQLCKQLLCSGKIAWKPGNGTGSLLQHYKAFHKALLEQWYTAKDARSTEDTSTHGESDDVSSIASPQPTKRAAPAAAAAASSSANSATATKRSKFEGPLLASFMGSSTQSVAKLAAIAFASARISFNVADNPEFRAFLLAMRYANAPPTRKSIAEATTVVHEDMRAQLLQRLRGSASPVAVAVDGWTNVRGTKITNIVLLCDGVAYYWCSIPNPTDKNTAVWLQQQIEPRLMELASFGIRFAAFVADNEAVNGALFRLLLEKFPFLVRIPCAAHTIQLIVKECFGAERWRKVRDAVDELLHGFSSKKEWRLQLRSIQESMKGTVYNLVKPTDTRWNSYLYACERLVKLQAPIEVIQRQDEGFWTELTALVEFLRPFQLSTDVVQKDTATLFDVFQQWNRLSKHVSDNTQGEVKKKAMNALKKRWQSQVNPDATIAAALLSLTDVTSDLSAESVDAARSFIVSFGMEFMKFFKLTSNPDALEGNLLLQVGQFATRSGKFQGLSAHIEKTKAVAGSQWTPVDVWSFYSMELATVARALLTMPATEAAVERTFSAQDSIHTKKRNRLVDASVEANMFVAFNHRPLQNENPSETRPPSTVELSLEFLEPAVEEQDDDAEEELLVTEPDDSDEEMPDASSPAAAPVRSHTEINAGTVVFLRAYITENAITLTTRWTAEKVNHLEQEAMEKNPGGNSTAELIGEIKKLLRLATVL